MTIYTNPYNSVKEMTGLYLGYDGTVRTIPRMYGGVDGVSRQIFPKYTINDLSHIEIRAENHEIRDENGRVLSSGGNYSPYEDWYDKENSSWHGASIYGAYQTTGKTDGWFAAYSWGRAESTVRGSIYAVFKDGSCVDFIRFLKNEAGYTKPGLTVNSYHMELQMKDYGNDRWYYRYRFGNASSSSNRISLGVSYLDNRYDAQSDWDKGHSAYKFNAHNIGWGDWEVYMQNLATEWDGSAMGFGMYPGQETATINDISIPVRLGTSISGLTLPNV